MTMTRDKIEQLKRLAEKATPGEWHTPGLCEVHSADHSIVAETFGFNDPEDDLPQGQHEANAAFIAAANPQTILSLLALAERALEPQGQALDLEALVCKHLGTFKHKPKKGREQEPALIVGNMSHVLALLQDYASQLALPAGPVPGDALHEGPEIVTDPVELRMLAQHRRLKARKWRTGEATADFDLPAPNDDCSPAVAQPVADERGAFEAAWVEIGGMRLEDYDLDYRPDTNTYADDIEQAAWEAWQARAALGQPAEEGGKS